MNSRPSGTLSPIARTRAAAGIHALDRAVSVDDVRSLALAFDGVRRAQVFRNPVRQRNLLTVVVAGEDGANGGLIDDNAHDGLKGGKGGPVVLLHQICHNEIHATLTEAEIARDYASVDALRGHPKLAAFFKWVAKRPPDFHSRSAGGRRKRRSGR